MLFIDASALTALVVREADYEGLADRIEAAPERLTSGIALWEAALAVARVRKSTPDLGWSEVNRYATTLALAVVPIGAGEAAHALAAFRLYGKGSGHPAQLNMGDCFAYACAKANGATLLYKGNDFIHTDLA